VSAEGIVVVDKPPGLTSHDVVDEVRRRLATRRVGHAGTLDPDATGILILGAGRATRFLSYAGSGPKRYTAVARFGMTTTTQDASGEVVDRRPVDVGRDDISAALPAFTGGINQLPPMVSAVKVGGERLYAKARRGEEAERSERRIEIFELRLTGWNPGESAATLEVCCSAGTYVRTLVHDLGRSLGCGAHLARLRRTSAGGFSEPDAVPLAACSPKDLRPLLDAVRLLPRLELDEEKARHVAHGRPLPNEAGVAEGARVALTRGAELLGVYRATDLHLVAERVVPATES
jgi:tRNA pseudouridine55 synthase